MSRKSKPQNDLYPSGTKVVSPMINDSRRVCGGYLPFCRSFLFDALGASFYDQLSRPSTREIECVFLFQFTFHCSMSCSLRPCSLRCN